MLVVLLTFSGDIIELRRLLSWIQVLDGKLDHDCLIVCDAAVSYRDAIELKDHAKAIFRQVKFTTNQVGVSGWIEGSYSLFKSAVKYVADKWPQPFLILEPDCVPLKKGWLDTIATDYGTCGKPFMGHIYKCDQPRMPERLMSGIAVYPADTVNRLVMRDRPVHWDVDGSAVMIEQGAHTSRIKHVFGTQAEAPTFVATKINGASAMTFTADMADDGQAVLFHRNKDGSLIRLLAVKQGLKPPAEKKTFIQLGRYGDIILLLPAWKHIYDTDGVRPRVITSREFGDVFEGVSYVDAVPIDCKWQEVKAAQEYAAEKKWKAIVTQGHGMGWAAPDPPNSPNYATAMHARSGVPVALMRKLPLIFDQRSADREAAAIPKLNGKPFIVVCTEGWTSPFKYSARLLLELDKLKSKVAVVDVSRMRLPRIFDLLGIMDKAIGTITVDTATLHLAHACPKPYIALKAEGGGSSVPRGNCVLEMHYGQFEGRIPDILRTVESWIVAPKRVPAVEVGKYMIGTGYFTKDPVAGAAQFKTWYGNTQQFSAAEEVAVLAVGGCKVPGAAGHWLNLTGNLGHTHDLTNKVKPYQWCGWSMGFVTLAMIAYANECDFIYKEQDCFAFGPWVKRLYAEIGTKGMIFGDSKSYACAQSLVLCKHSFIPEFVRLYMSTGSEQDKENECELKFARLEKDYPQDFGRFSFGCDRDRPIPYDADVWYVQQVKEGEMAELKRRKLLK